jgi:hypothetical protein
MNSAQRQGLNCKGFLPMKKAGFYALNYHSFAAMLIFWFIPPGW